MEDMLLTGQYCENLALSTTTMMKNIDRLTNQLWKLIPMRENEEDWRKQLNTVIIEIAGLQDISWQPQFLPLLSKLNGLAAIEMPFDYYRKTVFESISLLQGVKNGLR